MAQYETVSIGNLEDYLDIVTPFSQVHWNDFVIASGGWEGEDRFINKRFVPKEEDKEESIYRIE